MINKQIKVLDLEGMIIRTADFTVEFEISNSKEELKEELKELTIVTSPAGKKIFTGDYSKTNGLAVLVDDLEQASIDEVNEKKSDMLNQLSQKIKFM